MKLLATAITSAFLIGSICTSAAATPDSASTSTKMSDAQRDAKVDNHIKDLRAKLKITSAEEPQWTAVAKVMHDNATDIDTVIDKRETLNNPTAVDDLNAYGDIAQAHADAVKKLASAFSPLYASMSDDQKKIADNVFMQHQNKAAHSPTAMK